MTREQMLDKKLSQIASRCNGSALAAIYTATASGILLCAEILPGLMGGVLIASVAVAITSSLIGALISK